MNIHTQSQGRLLGADKSGSGLQHAAQSIAAIIAFIVFAFAWSWGLGFVASQIKPQSILVSTAVLMVSGFGPSIAAFVIVGAFSGSLGFRRWLAHCLNRNVGWRWFALAFLMPPLVMMVALVVHILLGGAILAPIAAAHIPLAIANFGLVSLVGGPLGEEFGWRGYAMSALLAQTTWRIASLLLGLVWGLWHLPLFFMGGTAQSQMPIFVFMLNILAGSVLFGWLFVRTKGSVLPAIVLHTSLNAWAGLLVIVPSAATGRPYDIVTGLLVIIAAALLILPDCASAKDLRQC
jgi:uncharacterized protein